MKLGRFLTAAAAVSLTAAPVVAHAAPVASDARIGSAEKGEKIGGSLIIPLIALAAVIVGVIVIAGGDDDEAPTSP